MYLQIELYPWRRQSDGINFCFANVIRKVVISSCVREMPSCMKICGILNLLYYTSFFLVSFSLCFFTFFSVSVFLWQCDFQTEIFFEPHSISKLIVFPNFCKVLILVICLVLSLMLTRNYYNEDPPIAF